VPERGGGPPEADNPDPIGLRALKRRERRARLNEYVAGLGRRNVSSRGCPGGTTRGCVVCSAVEIRRFGMAERATVGIERFLLCYGGKMTFLPNGSSYLCHS
jgi:hypothetical protein